MEYEWDENKNKANIIKHGIAFEKALEVFEGRYVTVASAFQAEKRYLAIGPLKDKMIAVVYTLRSEGIIRIISARSARHEEKRKYRTIHSQ